MKISIIIPIYNVQPYLERCVQSVLRQSFKNLEIILVDDGSTDGSGDLAKKLSAKDHRIRVIRQLNQGASAARNTGLRNATGEYVIYLDSDDEWLIDDGLEKLLKESPEGCDLIVFKRVDFWKDGRREDSEDYDLETIRGLSDASTIFAYLIKQQQFQLSACFLMTRRQVLLDYGIFFPVGLVDEDISWNLQLWQHVHTVSFHNLPFYGYFHRANSITTTYSIHVFHSNDHILTNWETLCLNGCVNSFSILSFLANIWVSLGYRTHMLKKAEQPEAINILKRHKFLLDYATSKKARRTALLVKSVGIRWTIGILGLYWRLRTSIKGNIV